MPLDYLMRVRKVQAGPVLHVGAHLAEEAAAYASAGFRPVWWVEANPMLVPALEERVKAYPDQHVIDAVLAERPRPVTLHIANNGQSSSILPLGTHAVEHPEVHYVAQIDLQATTVDALAAEKAIGQARFMNIDVQGAELEVLKGAETYLAGVQYVYTEVNEAELYQGCALMEELRSWLQDHRFDLVEEQLTRHGWGDALFTRRP